MSIQLEPVLRDETLRRATFYARLGDGPMVYREVRPDLVERAISSGLFGGLHRVSVELDSDWTTELTISVPDAAWDAMVAEVNFVASVLPTNFAGAIVAVVTERQRGGTRTSE